MEKQPLPQFRDLTELGEELGMSNLNTLYAEIKQGNLIAYKLGKAYKVPVEEYERYLEKRREEKEEEEEYQLYDLGDLAESVHVTMKYMYSEIKQGRLRVLKFGKKYKVMPDEWQRYLETKKPSSLLADGDEEER